LIEHLLYQHVNLQGYAYRQRQNSVQNACVGLMTAKYALYGEYGEYG